MSEILIRGTLIKAVTDNIYCEFTSVKPYQCNELKQWLQEAFGADGNEIFELMPYNDEHPSRLSERLPGVDLRVKHPVSGIEVQLRHIIIDLNDHVQPDKGRCWTREEIADWIEAKMPLESITFKPPEQPNEKALFNASKLFEIQRILPL